MNGPNCYKLLKNSHKLTEVLPENLKIFGTALEQLFKVVHDCFGRDLKDSYMKSIEDFETTYRQLPHAKDPEKQLSVTIKVHCIFQHVPETIERTGKGLGVFSAQAFEAVHPDFLETYQRFKVDPEHKDYGKQFKASYVIMIPFMFVTTRTIFFYIYPVYSPSDGIFCRLFVCKK